MTKTSGFTPLFDKVTKETKDTLTSLVYGFIWRYERLNNRKCTAAIKTIADELGLSYKTVERRLGILEESGWIEDTTPNWKNKPHEYKTKRRMEMHIAAKAESRSDTVRESVKETKKIQLKDITPLKIQLGELENLFSTFSGIPQPGWDKEPALMQKRWRTPIQRMYNLAGKDKKKTKQLMSQSIKDMRKDKLTISAPQSIEKTFTSLFGEQNTKDNTRGYKQA